MSYISFGFSVINRYLDDFKYLFGLDDALPQKDYMPSNWCLAF